VIVIVEDATWSAAAIEELDKLALVAACAGGRHVLLNRPSAVRPGGGRPEGLGAWLSSLSPKLRGEIGFVLDDGLAAGPGANQSGVARIRVVTGKDRWPEAKLTPATAAALLQRPLKVLLENRRNDLHFLLRMAEPTDRARLCKALSRGWVEPEMGGGLPELKKRLEALQSPSSVTERVALARLWVMFDRDANADDRSRPSHLSEQTRALCCALAVPWPLAHHQLARRAIESYVPAETLRAWWPEQVDSQKERQARQRRVEALLRLAPYGGLRREARHVFNFKKGLRGDLPGKARKAIDQDARSLNDDDLDPVFRGLHPDVRDALGKGFSGLAEAFSVQGAIQEEAFRREVDPVERGQILASLFSRL
jgi:hypothetical protein